MPQTRDSQKADQWWPRAKQARARADLMRDPIAKATMVEIAQKYEAMAERTDRREVIRRAPD